MEELIFHAIGISRLRMGRDGEGVTTLVAGYGCPLRCRYCLNPQCFLLEKPVKDYTVSSLLSEVIVDDLYFQSTGGGIVFGGGEPLLQAEFLHTFKQQCPANWKLSLESSLMVPTQKLALVIPDIDYFLIDCKDLNPAIYEAYTTQKPDLLYENLKLLIEAVDPDKITIRIPQIPSYNTKEDCLHTKAILENMGYTHFDFFTYDVALAQSKKEQIL